MFGDQVACVEQELVESWRAREGGRGYLTPEPPPAFQVGQQVRFKEGPFVGLEGTVIANCLPRNAWFLLEHLGMVVPVEADRSVLG